MKLWGWVVISLLALVLVSSIVVLVKATFWLVVVAGLVMIIVWLVGFVYHALSNMFNF